MAEQKNLTPSPMKQGRDSNFSDFLKKYNKTISAIGVLLLLGVGGWFGYQYFYQNPKEAKAQEAIFRAQSYFSKDSFSLALNGDGQNFGFLKVINRYGGTKAANLSHYYAGVCYIKLGNNEKAIEMLKKFNTNSPFIQANAYRLLGDASSETGKNKEALEYYKKAANHVEEDAIYSPEYLFMAAYLADQVMKDNKEAITLYKQILSKYPNSSRSDDAQKYLARLGEYNVDR